MRGEDRSRSPAAPQAAVRRGINRALRRALDTPFEPERDAQAAFDNLIDQLRGQPGSNKRGEGDEVAH